ncbi:MAG: peptidylprolyl isomerase [Spirochaetaceae bacterium]|jgi:peptidyl-prolyl cis-trans isomerase C|nr:peptidylprolyl isomerase [Spirochaetaceae bacterium]
MSKMNRKTIILIAAITLVVVAGGITSFLLLRDRGIAAVVNGVKITNEKVEEEVTKAIAQYETQGTPIQPEQLVEMRASVIDNMVIREVLLQESETIDLSKEEIETQISTFKTKFETEEQFIEALKVQGFDLESFTKVISDDLKIQKLMEENEPEEAVVSDEEITQFYNDNPAYFIQPERINASHILVSLQDKTTDEEKESALLKIKRIENELKNGADFAELAISESEGPSGPDGGNLGEFSKGQMVPEFEEAAFALSENTISGIVETQFGYHIIKLNERIPETSVPFGEVKQSIYDYLIKEKSQNSVSDFIDSLKSAAKIRIPGAKKRVEPLG